MPPPQRHSGRDARPAAIAPWRRAWWRPAAARLLVLAAAAMPVAAAPVVVVDDSGLVVSLPGPAQRVVSLSPDTTELLAAAGGAALLVGRMREADFPPAVQRASEVGALGVVDVARVRRLKPDLLLLRAGSLDARTLAALRALRVPMLAMNPRSADGIARALKLLGQVVGTPKPAQATQAAFDAQWRALQVGAGTRTPLRVFVQLSAAPLLTPTGGGLLGESLAACGAVSVFADAAAAPTAAPSASVPARPSPGGAANRRTTRAASAPAVAAGPQAQSTAPARPARPAPPAATAPAPMRAVTAQEVRQRAPQALVVVLAHSPTTPAGATELDTATAVWRAAPTLPAVLSRAVIPIAADEWLWPTPRWLDGTTQLCRALDALRQPH